MKTIEQLLEENRSAGKVFILHQHAELEVMASGMAAFTWLRILQARRVMEFLRIPYRAQRLLICGICWADTPEPDFWRRAHRYSHPCAPIPGPVPWECSGTETRADWLKVQQFFTRNYALNGVVDGLEESHETLTI